MRCADGNTQHNARAHVVVFLKAARKGGACSGLALNAAHHANRSTHALAGRAVVPKAGLELAGTLKSFFEAIVLVVKVRSNGEDDQVAQGLWLGVHAAGAVNVVVRSAEPGRGCSSPRGLTERAYACMHACTVRQRASSNL